MVSLERPVDPGLLDAPPGLFGREDGPPPPRIPTLPQVPAAVLPEVMTSDEEPTGVIGTLREMPVTEIVQTLGQALRDAVVEVKPRRDEPGTIVFERGRVIHCSTVSLEGEAAFFQLLAAQRGTFRIRYGTTAASGATRNVHRDTTFLLLEGARQLDERRARASGSLEAPQQPSFLSGPPESSVDESGWDEPLSPGDMPCPPPASGTCADGEPLTARGGGLFSRFFDEAGVKAPPTEPLPPATHVFRSLHTAGMDTPGGDAPGGDDPDGDAPHGDAHGGTDSDITRRERIPSSVHQRGPR